MEINYITPDIRETILEVAHHMHRHPELSTQELGTTALLADLLKKLENGSVLVFKHSAFLVQLLTTEK